MYYNVVDRDEVVKSLSQNRKKIEEAERKPDSKENRDELLRLMYAQLCKGLPLSVR